MSLIPNPAFFNHIVSQINANESVRDIVLNTGPDEVAMIIRGQRLRAATLAKATLLLHASEAEQARVAGIFEPTGEYVVVCLIDPEGERRGAPDFFVLRRDRFVSNLAKAV